MKISNLLFTAFIGMSLVSCGSSSKLAPIAKNALKPTIVTDQTPTDTDDPAIWINPANASESLVVGTDKSNDDGGLYVFDLEGKIVNKFVPLDRPNNVDVAYQLPFNGKKVDIAVATERGKKQIRVFSMPDLQPIDGGGIKVFKGEEKKRKAMGIALYTNPETKKIYAIVGRKEGPSGSYLWQYELYEKDGVVKGKKVRAFGNYSGKKEIEAIAVDNELGYVYCSDETFGIRKYYADPSKGNEELAVFGTEGFKRDHEGIAIYKSSETTGYIIVSNQQKNTFMVYPREGSEGDPNKHPLLAEIPLSSIECDGADATSVNLNPTFPKGMLIVMSNGKVFQYYDWRIILNEIEK